jgi:phosphatidylinositol glycan class B
MALNRPIPRSAGGLSPAAGYWLAGLCVAALAIRIAVAIFLPSIIHQDETFQYLEQGHRLVFGNGLVPWEYLVGARSWLFPGMIAGVIQVSRLFGGAPDTALLCISVFMAVLSLSTVVCGFLWGWRTSGLRAAVAAGALNACWFELVYFSGHTLSEPLAADALVVGLYWIYPGFKQVSKRSLFIGGIFLGLAFILRPQLGPAIAVGVIAVCGTELRARYLPVLLGALLPVIISGVLDAITWDWPFQSLALNVWINVRQGVAAEFSRAPFYQYLSLEVTYWSGAFALIVGLAIYAGRRLPVLLLVALTIFAVHTLLSHKEYRFIYPALPLIMTLVGIGSAGIAQSRAVVDRPAVLGRYFGDPGAVARVLSSLVSGSRFDRGDADHQRRFRSVRCGDRARRSVGPQRRICPSARWRRALRPQRNRSGGFGGGVQLSDRLQAGRLRG